MSRRKLFLDCMLLADVTSPRKVWRRHNVQYLKQFFSSVCIYILFTGRRMALNSRSTDTPDRFSFLFHPDCKQIWLLFSDVNINCERLPMPHMIVVSLFYLFSDNHDHLMIKRPDKYSLLCVFCTVLSDLRVKKEIYISEANMKYDYFCD